MVFTDSICVQFVLSSSDRGPLWPWFVTSEGPRVTTQLHTRNVHDKKILNTWLSKFQTSVTGQFMQVHTLTQQDLEERRLEDDVLLA